MPDTLVVESATVLSDQEEVSVLLETDDHVIVVSDTQQGPPGPIGPAGSVLFQGAAAQTVGGHRALRHTGGGLDYASAANVADAGRVAGVSTGAATAGDLVSYQAAGRLTEPSWAWTPDADIYLGLDGQLTQNVPVGAAFLQRLGYAIDATSMWIELSEPITLA